MIQMTRLIRLIRGLFFIGLLTGLTACATQATETQRYQLPTTSLNTATEIKDRSVLLLAPVALSELLYQPGIVMQTDDIILYPAQQHIWASDLQQQITLGLQRRLQQRLVDHLVVLSNKTYDKQIQIRLEAFQGHYDGVALMEGQWQLLSSEGQLEINSGIELTTTLSQDGYAALVRALGVNLDKLADQIAQRMNAN